MTKDKTQPNCDSSGCSDASFLTGRWRINEGVLCCGTLRIANFDFDTDPSDEFKQGVYKQMLDALNGPRRELELSAGNQVQCAICGSEFLSGQRHECVGRVDEERDWAEYDGDYDDGVARRRGGEVEATRQRRRVDDYDNSRI